LPQRAFEALAKRGQLVELTRVSPDPEVLQANTALGPT
jgi:hypothetical protein